VVIFHTPSLLYNTCNFGHLLLFASPGRAMDSSLPNAQPVTIITSCCYPHSRQQRPLVLLTKSTNQDKIAGNICNISHRLEKPVSWVLYAKMKNIQTYIILDPEHASGSVQGSGTWTQYRRTTLETFPPHAFFLLLSHRSRSQVTGFSSGHDTGCSRTIFDHIVHKWEILS